jgi:hypothetical protein
LREALEAPLQKTGASRVGTGAFKTVAGSTTDMESNADYYLGRPFIDSIHVETFSNVRAAWADLLRERIDMLWEVGPEALDSIKDSSNVSLFTFTRRYQHVIVFNTEAPALTANVRRALSYAVDRAAGRCGQNTGPLLPIPRSSPSIRSYLSPCSPGGRALSVSGVSSRRIRSMSELRSKSNGNLPPLASRWTSKALHVTKSSKGPRNISTKRP